MSILSTLIIGSGNTWSGSVADTTNDANHVVNYYVNKARQCDLIGLYDVHMPRRPCSSRFWQPKSPTGRPGRIDLELGQRIAQQLQDTHHAEFVPHFTHPALHDCEVISEPVDYGNLVLIRKQLTKRPYKIATDRMIVYGHGELNTENSLTFYGRPASRQAIVSTLQVYGQAVTIACIHGLWSKRGKIDFPARIAQSAYIGQGIRYHRNRQGIQDALGQILLLGDFNLTSNQEAMQNLLQNKDAFGPDGGTNLTPHCDTRTSWYPVDKPTREANFVLASAAAVKRTLTISHDADAPSDHAYTETTYNISPGTL